MNPKVLKKFSAPYIVWMLIFTIVPLLIMGYYGLTTRDGAFTLENVKSIFEYEHMKAFLLSVKLSLIDTVICLVLSYPLAMVIKSLEIQSNGIIIFIFILPMWMNFLLRTMAWQSLLEKTGIINSILNFFGVPALRMINTEGAIVLGMVYNFLPFMILPIYNSLVKISDDTLNAARDLGANEKQVFTKIIVPLTFPGVVSGITMVFVPALTTFVISDLLGGNKIQLIGNIIENEFTTANNWNLGAGLSLVLMIIILGSMAIMSRYDKNGEGAALW